MKIRQLQAEGSSELCAKSVPVSCESCVHLRRILSNQALLQLVSVLREVKYLDVGDSDDIPEEASKIFAAKESFRQYVANLDLTQQWYNKVRQKV